MAKMPQEKHPPTEGSPPNGTGAFAPGNGVQDGDEAFCPAALRGISQRKMKDRWIENLSANLHGLLFQVRRAPSGKDLIACIGGTLASYFGFSPDNAPVDRDAFFRNVSPGDLQGLSGLSMKPWKRRAPGGVSSVSNFLSAAGFSSRERRHRRRSLRAAFCGTGSSRM